MFSDVIVRAALVAERGSGCCCDIDRASMR